MPVTGVGAGVTGSRAALRLSDVVFLPPVVPLADEFLDLEIWTPGKIESNGPWPRVGPRIIDRDFDVKIVQARARDSFDHVHLVGMRMALIINPGSFIEANGIHNQRITFPVADRVSRKRGEVFEILFRRMWAPIQKNLAPRASWKFPDLDDAFLFKELNKFCRARTFVPLRPRSRRN